MEKLSHPTKILCGRVLSESRGSKTIARIHALARDQVIGNPNSISTIRTTIKRTAESSTHTTPSVSGDLRTRSTIRMPAAKTANKKPTNKMPYMKLMEIRIAGLL